MNAPRIIKNIPAGYYYVGDPCYVFNNNGNADSWEKIIEISDCFDIPQIEFNGKQIIAFGTKFGDGTYNGFSVDSGLIGIVDIRLIEEGSAFFNESFDRAKHLVSFDEPFDFEWDDGNFHIGGRISIYTNDDDDYDHDDYELYDEDDYEYDGDEDEDDYEW